MYMKKLFSLSIIASSLLFNHQSKADENYYLNYDSDAYANPTYEILKSTISGDTNKIDLITTFDTSTYDAYLDTRSTWIDYSLNKIYLNEVTRFNGTSGRFTGNTWSYSIDNDSWSSETLSISSGDSTPHLYHIGNNSQTATSTNSSNISSNDTDISALQGLISTKSGSTTTARIGDSTKNTLEIGGDTNPTTINQEGISVGGSNLIKKQSNGDIHIGKNSFVIGNDVLNGAHPIWAEDENGTKIPLNIYGSDLQINGVSVQGQINTNKSNIKNLGSGVAGSTALTAALSALPQTSKESKLSCGVGTGAYSSRYAVGFGCASKVNERVDVNAGGSYVFGGSKSYGGGTLDSGVVKAGFVFKLGELNKSTQISMKEKKEFKKEISVLKENNERIISQNKNLEIKNQAIIDQNKSLLARLERLEKLALGKTKSKDLAVYKLK